MSESPFWLLATSVYAVMASWLVCQYAHPLALRFRLMDIPKGIKAHKAPTPLVGGVTLLLLMAFIVPIVIIVFDARGVGNASLTIMVTCTLVCALIGIGDDRHAISAVLRLVATVALFLAAILLDQHFLISQVRFTGHATVYQLSTVPSIIFTITVLVGFLNAVNMADGKNGLVISMSMVWAFILSVVGPPGLVIIMLPIVLMLCVLFIYNMQSRIFLGDGGSYGLSAFFGLNSIFVYNTGSSLATADMMTLFFIVPGLDMIRLVATRLLKRSSPLKGDRDHLHHHLFTLFGWPQGLLVYVALIIVPVTYALLDPRKTEVILAVTIAAYAAIVSLAISINLKRARAVAQAGDQAQSTGPRLTSAEPSAERVEPLIVE